ncbi:MAG: penicillin-binding protein 1C [Kofleriaceae bacterium]
MALLVVIGLAYVVPLPDRETGWSSVVEYRDGRPAYVFLSGDDKWRLHVTLDRVDPKLVEALIALEDKRFWSHMGVDPIAIGRAAWLDITRGRRVSGGSTLSMQLARLYEPRARTIPNKLVDMFRAVQLDLRLPKQEILEEYLSRTPYGENVEGIESAAWSYFGHGPQHLTPVEIATLLAVPQGPARYAPSLANLKRLTERRDAILGKLIDAGVFGGVDATAALADAKMNAPPTALKSMPREAAHAAIWLRAKHPLEVRIRSTLDAGLQALVEKQVAMRESELHAKQIHGASVVVVDHRSREVVALVGNLDFMDAQHGGQIAMFDRPRSPGSTLKPFLYAMTIDRGLALPEYLVADVPTQYGTYKPKNFDGDFAGLVTLKEALARSLNLPFVDLLAALGVEPFVAELARMGIPPDRSQPGKYGLSMVVGGIELTPLEIAGMYATLAEDGVYRSLRLADTDPIGPPQPIFGKGAAYLTRQALEIKDRPDFPRRRDFNGVPAEIHWKTGTSFGFRDAWAVGSGPAYTTAVWMGNVDQKPANDLVGADAAGPLLFDVLEGVGKHEHKAETQPDDLVEVEVCAYSGHIPGDACDHRIKVLAPVHAVPTAPCPYHQAFDVDASGHAVVPACKREGVAYERKHFVVLPSAVGSWLASRDRNIPDAPQFADGCAPEVGATAPVIMTPGEGQQVNLIPGLPAKAQQVPLQASSHATTLSWFVDGALIATAPSSERVYWVPNAGHHELVVADEAGRKARRVLDVKTGVY